MSYVWIDFVTSYVRSIIASENFQYQSRTFISVQRILLETFGWYLWESQVRGITKVLWVSCFPPWIYKLNKKIQQLDRFNQSTHKMLKIGFGFLWAHSSLPECSFFINKIILQWKKQNNWYKLVDSPIKEVY